MMRHSDNAIVFLRPASLERGKPILASGALMSIWSLCVPGPRLSVRVEVELAKGCAWLR
jgi:hypothetical protein